MNTNKEIPIPNSLAIVARWLDSHGEGYYFATGGAIIQSRWELTEATFFLGCFESDGFFQIVTAFPVKSSKDKRMAVRDYLKRFRQEASDPNLEVGYDLESGEVRFRLRLDLAVAVFDESIFELMLRSILFFADKTFPYLNCVMTGAMKPDFALDQTLAAIRDNQSE